MGSTRAARRAGNAQATAATNGQHGHGGGKGQWVVSPYPEEQSVEKACQHQRADHPCHYSQSDQLASLDQHRAASPAGSGRRAPCGYRFSAVR
jgi:hypothetical protein